MTSLRFVGDLPVWLGITLALAAAAFSFAYYRRESFDLPGVLRWLLPLLRATAIALAILVFTGPVLHHRQEVGELGHVRIVVDTTQSMDVGDPPMALARKIRIANDQGWLPKGQLDTRFADLSDRIARLRQQRTRETIDSDVTPQFAQDLRAFVVQEIRQIAKLSDAVNSAGIVQDTTDRPQQVREAFDRDVYQPMNDLEDQAVSDPEQAGALVVQLGQLIEKLAPLQQFYDEQFAAYVDRWVASMGKVAEVGLQRFDQSTRSSRIQSRLLQPESGLVSQLKETHHLEVGVLHGERVISVWSSRGDDPIPSGFDGHLSATSTNLASGIVADNPTESGDPEAGTLTNHATVILSDGQHNSGPSPVQSARIARTSGDLVYTIGYGTQTEPTDLAMVSVEYPDTVHKSDRVQGTLVFKDRMPEGSPFVVQIQSGDRVVWRKELVSTNAAQRRLDFDLGIEELVDETVERFASQVDYQSIVLELAAMILPVDGESETDNNVQSMRIAAITQRQKVLLIDGRSRWETRYLRNLFERDSGWEINTVIVGRGSEDQVLKRGKTSGTFPDSRDALFEYDVIIYGDVESSLFNATETAWLREFVERRGGGMIFLDGLRGHQQRFEADTLGPLLPVSWTGVQPTRKADVLELTEVGAESPAMLLASSGPENSRFWERLPAPHRVIGVEPLAGAEVFAEVVTGNVRQPLIVARNFGAGRVLYFAFDETWRWRYSVADKYHQRFWNQIARWAMSRPFAVNDEYLSLDSGSPQYDAGDTATIRARLRGPGGDLVTDATVDALLWRDGKVVSTIPLTPDDSMPGSYRAESAPLAPGNYRVTIQASGFAESAFQANTDFVVHEPENKEIDQVACNEDLLQAIALAGGGDFLREEDIGRIIDFLKPLSSGRVIESDTLLWQSWWWFWAIVGLLAVEWFLRKRIGLL